MTNNHAVVRCPTLGAWLIVVTAVGCSSNHSNPTADVGSAGVAGKPTAVAGASGGMIRNSAGAAGTSRNLEQAHSGSTAIASAGRSGSAGGGVGSQAGTIGFAGTAGIAGAPGNGARGGATSAAGAQGIAGSTVQVGRLTVSVDSPSIRAVVNSIATVLVTITREGLSDGEVNVTVAGLPTGAAVPFAKVPAGSTTVKLSFSFQSGVKVGGVYPVDVLASSAIDPSVSTRTNVVFRIVDRSGTLDTSLGTTGVTNPAPFPQGIDGVSTTEHATGVAIDANGRAVVSGYSTTATQRRGWVMRLAGDGQLDQSFASNGRQLNFGRHSRGLTR